MIGWGLTDPFDIDDGSLDGLTPEQAVEIADEARETDWRDA